jgi:hypothetical protein
MLVVAGIERRRKGRQAARYQEYGFILLCGVLGAALGAANDALTSSLSPEYFILGKDLPGEHPRLEAVNLGLSAGFSAGIIGGALSLFALGRKRPPFKRLLPMLAIPALSAMSLGGAFFLIAPDADPTRLTDQLRELLTPEQIRRFRLVWWIHTGLYAGFVLGLAAMIALARRRRGQTASLGGTPRP